MRLSVFNPGSPQAFQLLWLWNICIWVCGFVLASVTLSVLYIIVRYRARDDHQRSQLAGNRKLEITSTALPFALLGLLFVLNIKIARAIHRPIRREPDIIVTGHQWSSAVEYPAANAITANEIRWDGAVLFTASMWFAIPFLLTFTNGGLTFRSNSLVSTLNRNPIWRFCP